MLFVLREIPRVQARRRISLLPFPFLFSCIHFFFLFMCTPPFTLSFVSDLCFLALYGHCGMPPLFWNVVVPFKFFFFFFTSVENQQQLQLTANYAFLAKRSQEGMGQQQQQPLCGGLKKHGIVAMRTHAQHVLNNNDINNNNAGPYILRR